MTVRTPRVGKKKPKPPVGDTPPTPPGSTGKTTVKMDVELHRKARTVASYLGLELVDYLDQILRGPVEQAYADMARKIQEGDVG